MATRYKTRLLHLMETFMQMDGVFTSYDLVGRSFLSSSFSFAVHGGENRGGYPKLMRGPTFRDEAANRLNYPVCLCERADPTGTQSKSSMLWEETVTNNACFNIELLQDFLSQSDLILLLLPDSLIDCIGRHTSSHVVSVTRILGRGVSPQSYDRPI
jgi:hypothetical protein